MPSFLGVLDCTMSTWLTWEHFLDSSSLYGSGLDLTGEEVDLKIDVKHRPYLQKIIDIRYVDGQIETLVLFTLSSV